MSRHHFHTTNKGQFVLVTIGWDRPLQGYFMMVEKQGISESQDEDQFLFNNLEWIESHPIILEPFIDELKKLEIDLPNPIYQELRADSTGNIGNKMVEWHMCNGCLERKQLLPKPEKS